MLQRRPREAGRRADRNAPTEANASFERALDTRRTPPQRPRRRRVWSDVCWCLLGAFTLFLWFADTRPRPGHAPIGAPAANAALTPTPLQAEPVERRAPAASLDPAPPQELGAVAQPPRARKASRRAAHKHAKRGAKIVSTRTKSKHRQHLTRHRRRG